MSDLSDAIATASLALANGSTALGQLAKVISSIPVPTAPATPVQPSSAAPPIAQAPPGLPADIITTPHSNGVIYDYGNTFTYPAPNGGAAHADYTVGSQTIKNHFWGSRWYDGPFTPKNKIADLIAAKLIPPFGKSLANITAHIFNGMYDSAGRPNPLGYSGPFDYQLPVEMGQSGDNGAISPYSEWESARIALDDSALDASISALAHNGLTLPIHVRDPKSGKPISYTDYPQFCVYANQQNSMIAPGLRTAIVGFTPAPPGIQFDAAHHPQFFALAGYLTDDPVWLEEMQYLATFCWSFDYPENTAQHEDNLQVREMAWDMMTIANVIAMTRYFEKRGALPATCLPSQYFVDTMLTPTIKWLSNFFGDTSPAGYAKVLQWAPYVYAPWQWDFFALAVACGIYMGIPELQPVFNWVKVQLMTRLAGLNGWNARFPTFYYIQKATTWQAAFAEAVAEDPILATDDPSKPFPPALMNGYTDYVNWAAAAARMGKLIGDADLAPLSAALDQKIKASGIPVNYRHTIGGVA